MNRNRVLDLWVGLFVLLGIAAIAFLALRAANASSYSSEATYTLEGRFDNIGSLKVRAPVRSAGVMVGRVSSIAFDAETYEAIVSFKVGARYPFPKDTSAKILTAGLLGEQYVGLTAGGDAVMFKDGDTVRLTQSAVVLENLIGQFLYNKAAEGGGSASGEGRK
jgi:phospholipid/cholesterol/gamma-HCH transport system substrate-binding protein